MLHPVSYYARELKPALPTASFTPGRSRLWWLPFHCTLIAVGVLGLRLGWVPWPFAVLVSLVIGASFAGLTFLGHEILPVAEVRGRLGRRVFGSICFLGCADARPFHAGPRSLTCARGLLPTALQSRAPKRPFAPAKRR